MKKTLFYILFFLFSTSAFAEQPTMVNGFLNLRWGYSREDVLSKLEGKVSAEELNAMKLVTDKDLVFSDIKIHGYSFEKCVLSFKKYGLSSAMFSIEYKSESEALKVHSSLEVKLKELYNGLQFMNAGNMRAWLEKNGEGFNSVSLMIVDQKNGSFSLSLNYMGVGEPGGSSKLRITPQKPPKKESVSSPKPIPVVLKKPSTKELIDGVWGLGFGISREAASKVITEKGYGKQLSLNDGVFNDPKMMYLKNVTVNDIDFETFFAELFEDQLFSIVLKYEHNRVEQANIAHRKLINILEKKYGDITETTDSFIQWLDTANNRTVILQRSDEYSLILIYEDKRLRTLKENIEKTDF